MTHFYFLRHGESVMNARASELVGGRSNHTELTARGRDQAKRAGNWLLAHHIIPTQLIASPAIRTVDTLILCRDAMGGTLPIMTDSQLQELSQGVMEGRARNKVWTDERRALLAKDPMNFALLGGESGHDVQARMYQRILELAARYPSETVLIGAHGLSTRMLAGKILGWEHHQILYEASTPNCSLTSIDVHQGNFHVNYVGRDIAQD